MSDITISSTLDIGTTRHNASVTYTQANAGLQHGVKSVGTSEESVTIDSDLVATPRLVWLYNQDATNFVEFGTATGVYPIKLLAGDAFPVPINSTTTTLYFKSDTAACEVEYIVVEL